MMSKKGQKLGSDSKSTMTSNGKAGTAATPSPPPANAWSQPLRPKPNSAQGPPPGMGKGKGQSGSNNGGGGGGSANNQNALRERFIGLSLNMVGQKVSVTQTNGAIFEGIFHTFSPFASLPAITKNKFVIKACKVIKPPQNEDAKKSTQVVDQSTVIIAAEKVACLTVKSMRIDTMGTGANGSSQKKNSDGFRTDTEISGAKGGRSRDLVAAGTAWTTGGGSNTRADALMGSLDDKDKGTRRKPVAALNATAGLRGTIGEWDQFRANQELFNVKGTYDENLYTTELDKTQIDNRKIAEAERLAREIENTTSKNIHIAEERGHVLQGDYDEEDLYSGVLKPTVNAVPPTSKANSENQEKPKNDDQKSSSAGPKKMNYAAAAAKADPAKTTGPPGFASSNDEETEAAESKEKEGDADAPDESPDEQPQNNDSAKAAVADKSDATKKQVESVKVGSKSSAEEVSKGKKAATADSEKPNRDKLATTDPKGGEKAPTDSSEKPSGKSSSKLNANAKVFSLNATAKVFTPGAPAPAPAPEGQFVDPNAAMHVASHMPGPHYMHGAPPMGQPGMMPMMNPQFPGGVRYPAGYGMDQQHMPQMTQPQHVNSSGHGSGAPSPGPASVDENAAQPQQEGETGTSAAPAAPAAPVPQQPQQQQGQPPQPQVPVPYGVPPPAPYYTGGMAMHPRGPGQHPGYHPQFVGGPQQMVGPGGAPYRHIYPMQPGGMAPNVQVRGPGAPYYGGPVAPVPYPPNPYVGHGMMDDDSGFRGGQRGGRSGRGSGRRARGRSGRGGRAYNSYHQHGGRHSGQNQNGPSESWSGDGGSAQPDGPSGANNQAGKPGEKK